MQSSGREAFHVVAYPSSSETSRSRIPSWPSFAARLRELRDGRRPLTVLLAGGAATPETAAHREELAFRWIASAWQHYRSMCIDGGRARSPEAATAA